MRKANVLFCAVLCIGFMAASHAQAGFAGKWTITQERQGQQRVSTLTLEGSDSALGGTWSTQRGESALTNVKVSDGTLSFVRTFNRQGQSFEITCEAKLVDGKLMGKMITQRGEREFVAIREMAAPDFFGSWDILLNFGGREVEVQLSIDEGDAGAVSGMWSSQRGDAALDNVAIDGDTLTFARTMERQGQEFTIDYSAKIVDGSLEGNMTTPRGDMPFTGTKVKAEEGDNRAVAMLKQLDVNNDGGVSEDEAPEQMKEFFDMIDADGNGSIDGTEMQTVIDFMDGQN